MVSEQFNKFRDEFETNIFVDMGKKRIPGTVIALIENGTIIYQGNFGTKNRTTNAPVDQNTLFGIGSCTKSFTSLAMQQLAEKNFLKLDDPVAKYIPLKLGSADNPIKVRHLMSHASGIPALDSSVTINYMLGEDKEIPIIPLSTKEDFFRFVNNAQSEVLFGPGEQFYYFNAGYAMLGYIIEEVSGLKYEDYIQQNIFDPLMMTDSAFLGNKQLETNSKLAQGYYNRKLDIVPINLSVDHINNPAGGIISNIPDLIKYLQALMTKDPKLLKNHESYDELFKAQILSDMFNTAIPNAELLGYGFGWVLLKNFHGKNLIWHGGNTGNYSAELLFIPENNLGMIVLANASSDPSLNHYITLLQAYLGYNPKEVNMIYQKHMNMNKFVGKYTNYQGFYTAEVNNKGGTLFFELKSELQPLSIPLFPKTDELNCLDYYYYNENGFKEKIFFIEKNGVLYLKLDRLLFTKIK